MRTLDTTRDELVERLDRLTPDTPRQWGTMTAHEMLCHVGDLFRLAVGERDLPLKGKLVHRTLMKWFALYVPLHWPKNVSTLSRANPRKAGTKPAVFEEDRAEVIRLMDAFRARSEPFPVHPLFGPLSRRQWMRWAHLHTDHHLRQFGV